MDSMTTSMPSQKHRHFTAEDILDSLSSEDDDPGNIPRKRTRGLTQTSAQKRKSVNLDSDESDSSKSSSNISGYWHHSGSSLDEENEEPSIATTSFYNKRKRQCYLSPLERRELPMKEIKLVARNGKNATNRVKSSENKNTRPNENAKGKHSPKARTVTRSTERKPLALSNTPADFTSQRKKSIDKDCVGEIRQIAGNKGSIKSPVKAQDVQETSLPQGGRKFFKHKRSHSDSGKCKTISTATSMLAHKGFKLTFQPKTLNQQSGVKSEPANASTKTVANNTKNNSMSDKQDRQCPELSKHKDTGPHTSFVPAGSIPITSDTQPQDDANKDSQELISSESGKSAATLAEDETEETAGTQEQQGEHKRENTINSFPVHQDRSSQDHQSASTKDKEEKLDTTSGSGRSSPADSVALVPEMFEDMDDQPDVYSSTTDEVSSTPSTGKKLFPIFLRQNRRSPAKASDAQSVLTSKASSSPATPKGGSPRFGGSAKLQRSPKAQKWIKDKDGKEQLILDCGQKRFGATQCPTCGMTYTLGEAEDELMHKKFHQRLLTALRFPGWKKERVLRENIDGSRIIVIMADEKAAMKKVAAVKQLVDEDLGFVVDSPLSKAYTKTFFYISAEKRVVGVCIAELITKGYRVIPESQSSDGEKTQGVRPWCCSTEPEPAKCGINRIWVLGSERRNRVATKLLDCVRCNFMMGNVLKAEDLAFSDPTPDGRQFATRYTEMTDFLVYKHT